MPGTPSMCLAARPASATRNGLPRLYEYGLPRASFRPRAEIAGSRAYLRRRERLLDYAAAPIQHMQKALERLPYTWNHVIEKESLKFKELEHVLMRHRIYSMS